MVAVVRGGPGERAVRLRELAVDGLEGHHLRRGERAVGVARAADVFARVERGHERAGEKEVVRRCKLAGEEV